MQKDNVRNVGAVKKYWKLACLGFCLGILLVWVLAIIGHMSQFLKAGEKGYPSSKINDTAPNPPETSGRDEQIFNGQKDGKDYEVFPSAGEGYEIFSSGNLPKGYFNVLLIGVDNRPDQAYLSNTDSLVVASFDRQANRLALLSIPRDTQVDIPGYGREKINAAARLGKGVKTTVSSVERLIGQTIDGYVVANFDGFKKIIDILGGVTITVEKDMYFATGDETDGLINLKKGTQRLSGSQALQYARFRHDELADISRTARQQALLRAIFRETVQVKNIPKLPVLIPQIYQVVETDLSLRQLWSLAQIFFRNEQVQIVNQTLPGKFSIEQGISYWKVNPEECQKVTEKLFRHGETSPVFSGRNEDLEQTNSSKLVRQPNTPMPREAEPPRNNQENSGTSGSGSAKKEKDGLDGSVKHDTSIRQHVGEPVQTIEIFLN